MEFLVQMYIVQPQLLLYRWPRLSQSKGREKRSRFVDKYIRTVTLHNTTIYTHCLGDRGQKGSNGAAGVTGLKGPKGNDGTKGERGDSGDREPRGVIGDYI